MLILQITTIRYNCNDARNRLFKQICCIACIKRHTRFYVYIHVRIKIFIIHFSHSLFSTLQSLRKTYEDIFITRPDIFWSRFQTQNFCYDRTPFLIHTLISSWQNSLMPWISYSQIQLLYASDLREVSKKKKKKYFTFATKISFQSPYYIYSSFQTHTKHREEREKKNRNLEELLESLPTMERQLSKSGRQTFAPLKSPRLTYFVIVSLPHFVLLSPFLAI